MLAGTTEATAFARATADRGLDGIVSFAGRVERPLRQPLPQRVGGFGGIAGLVAYLRTEKITHVIDATHPFAVQMSHHAVAACAEAGVPLVALTRPAWAPVAGDRWIHVPDIAGAVGALERPASRVMLAVGRMHLDAFAPNPQHFYLLRLVDPPKGELPFPCAKVIMDRGPFDADADQKLMEEFRINIVVSKNAGGSGAYAKIAAARALCLPVVMIERPLAPSRRELHSVEAVFHWLSHCPTDRGV